MSEAPDLSSYARCFFCPKGEPTGDLARCGWPTLKFRLAKLREVEPGDYVHRAWDSRPHPPALVVEIREQPDEKGRAGFSVTLAINPGTERWRKKGFWGEPDDLLRRQYEGRCDALCCDLHHRDVGDRFYCSGHWKMGIS